MSIRTSGRRAAVLATVVLLAACGSSEGLGGKVVKDGLGCQPTETERRTEVPTVEAVADVPKDVATDDLEKGKGCGIDTETYLTLDLVGATATDGKVFNDTFAAERPVTATLGSGQLLAGLETGLEGMKVGGRRQITVPADQAYGKEGNLAQGIAADQALVFVVDLVAVSDTPRYCNAATVPPGPEGSGKPTEVEMPVEAPTGEVVTTVLRKGDGETVKADGYATVNYLGVSCGTGQQFASSWDEDGGGEIIAALGEAAAAGTAVQVIPGWSEGLEGAKVGSLVKLDIPYALAYGAAGRPPTIGPSMPLTFVIEVRAFTTEAPADPSIPPAEGPSTTVLDDTTSTTVAGSTTTSTSGE